jgi:hypothetical protein
LVRNELHINRSGARKLGQLYARVCDFGGRVKSRNDWNLIHTYNPDVIIGTESWLREEIGNAEVFRDDYTTFRRHRNTRGGGVFICVKNHIDCLEIWADEYFEMIAVEVKGKDPRCAWEIVGIYRAPNEDMLVIESLATPADTTGNFTKRGIIWNLNVECTTGGYESVNSLMWESGYTQVVKNPDVYLVRAKNVFTFAAL